MKKRIISFVLIMVMAIGFMPTLTFAANTTEFAGGSGTEADPYLIETKYHLNNVRNYPAAHFKMIRDIEFTNSDFAKGGDFYNNGQGWVPIGKNDAERFYGTFDGNGYTIKNLCVNTQSSGCQAVGLFGILFGTIKNLGVIEGGIFTSSNRVGGIVGYNGGTISNCFNTGSVSTTYLYTYTLSVGGIAGYNHGKISNCYNAGIVSGDNSDYTFVGGIVGDNQGEINNCYNIGVVFSNAPSSQIHDFVELGGIAGHNYRDGMINNCYFLDNVLNGVYKNFGSVTTVKCTDAQLKEKSTFTLFDFEKVWNFAEGNVYPYPTLKNNEYYLIDENAEFQGGDGSENNPYLIASTKQLDNVRNHLDSHFKLVRDIKFTDDDFTEGGNFYNNGQGFTPIGTDSFSKFTGTFDGNGFIIKNLYINILSSYGVYAGLFGYSIGTIKNLGIVDSTVSATSSSNYTFTGGVAGCSHGAIINCYNTGSVSASSLSSSSYVGGIAGYNSSGTIENCYNTGAVAASSSGTITKPYSGGIVGYSDNGTIENCYNIGFVSVSSSSRYAYAGGVAGSNVACTITNCYFLDTISEGVGNGTDTTTKYTAGQMKSQSTFVGYDFENVWTMAGNKCYPYAELQNVKTISDHYFDNACDTTCDCGFTRTITHNYKDTYNAAGHFEECTVCGSIGDGAPHEFDNACDKDCACGYTRITTHKYDNNCDTSCNICGTTRIITHSFGAYIYNKDATYEKDGTRTRTCSVCGHKETIIVEGTKLEKTLVDSSKLFIDIPAKKWFKEYVDYSVTYGIFSGTSANTFSPNYNITRAQFVQVLANLEGVDTSNRNIDSGFTDVPKGKWYTAAVTWAAKNGIVNGVGAGKFDPNANVTREQMCVMLTNYAKFKGITLKAVEAKENFADDGKISKWAKDAVYICQQADIVNGKGAGMFDPKGTGTRAEACVIFTKFHKDFVA